MFEMEVTARESTILVSIANISLDVRVYQTLVEALKSRSVAYDENLGSYQLENTEDNNLLIDSIIDYNKEISLQEEAIFKGGIDD